ncbi:glycosyl hydrolase-related protein, partial [Dehalococcoidales bacterium]|nr:glycosyl hydrolase-related protein [Dehalococcoidales bacterium]
WTISHARYHAAHREVLVREILFGKKYCQQKFGIEVRLAWAADSFGLNAQLPQIYNKAGYKWLAFRRGAKMGITQSEFLWRGLDGTTILTHWMRLGYRAGLYLNQWEVAYITLDKYASTHHILMPCGSGSMPPQAEIPQAVNDWNETHPSVKMKIATPSEFFQALEKTEKRFEIIDGELYDDELVEVFPQVASSRIWIVQGARECEGLLITAEEFATIAWLLGANYPADELNQAWKKILFIAFHDIITGCGVDEIYQEVWQIFYSLKTKLSKLLSQSLAYIGQKVSTNGNGVIVFNPLTWRMRNWVEVNLPEPGVNVESQIIEIDRNEQGKVNKIGFIGDVPPLGYKVYKVVPGEKQPETKIKVEEQALENPFFKVEVDKETGIIQVFDKAGKSLVKGNELVIEDESGDLYYHRSRFATELIKSESGDGFEYGSFKPKGFKIEYGRLRSKIIFEGEYYCLTWPYRLKERFPPMLYKYKTLDIRKEVIVFRDLPRIEFITRVDNKYPNIRLRVKFDTGMDRKTYLRETQFGVIYEPTERFAGRDRGYKPSKIPHFMSWFDYSDGTRGIIFMNKGLPASEIVEGTVYITLLRSVYGLSADGISGPLVPTQDALELKPFTFEYSLQFHQGDWRQAEVYKQAQEYHHSLIPVEANAKGDLPSEYSFLELKPNNLILSALKKAEGSDEVILRFFETKGEATTAELKVFKPIKQAWITDLLEKEEKELEAGTNALQLPIKPFEIVTLKLRF